jgi:hypothetical protein
MSAERPESSNANVLLLHKHTNNSNKTAILFLLSVSIYH